MSRHSYIMTFVQHTDILGYISVFPPDVVVRGGSREDIKYRAMKAAEGLAFKADSDILEASAQATRAKFVQEIGRMLTCDPSPYSAKVIVKGEFMDMLLEEL